MATIGEVRQKYPQYSDLSDEQLGQALHRKYYSDMPYEQFAGKVGLTTTPAAQPETAPQASSGNARQLGLGTRASIEGVASLVTGPSDLLGAVYNNTARPLVNAATQRLVGRDVLPEYQSNAGLLSEGLTRAGLPNAETTEERLMSDVVRGGAAGVAMPAAATQIPGRVGAFLFQRPIVQTVGGMGGGGSAGLAREEGFGPFGQFVAGMAGGTAASGFATGVPNATRAAFRGPTSNVPQMQRTIDDFATVGDRPSVGQVTGNRRMQATENMLSRAPGGAGPLAVRAEQQAANIGARLDARASELAPRANGEQAGRAIDRGLNAFSRDFRSRAETLYSEVDRYIAPDSRVAVTNTQRVLNDVTSPIAGAERTSRMLANPKMAQIRDALGADMDQPLDALLLRGPQAIPYEAIKGLRSRVGKMLTESSLVDDVPRAELKRLYGALSQDLAAAAEAAGPQAARAATRANGFWRAGMARVDAVENVINRSGGPERIFEAATSGSREGATTLRAVMQSLPKEGQRVVTATVLRRLGRANPSQQDDVGGTFSTETFLTNWNRLSPEAKRALFDRHGPKFRENMDTVARVAANLRDGAQVFRNPSGTAQATVQQGTVFGFVMSLVTGNFGAAGVIAGGVGSANLSARLMTNPTFVRWLATNSRVPSERIPIALNQLAQQAQGDPDIEEFIASLQQQEQPGQ